MSSSLHTDVGTPGLLPLPANLPVEWEQVRTVLLCQGEPAWVPFMEDELALSHRERVLGRPPRTLTDEVDVARRLGQPFVRVTISLQNHPVVKVAISADDMQPRSAAAGDRAWVREQRGVIGAQADMEAFPWPTPDDFDYGVLDEADRTLPDSFKLVVAVGKIFNLGWWLMGFEQYCLALHDQPAMVEELHARIARIQMGIVERALEHKCVGAIRHADDMAYRTGLMTSPTILRRCILPYYRTINRECQLRDIPVIFHSDGKMDDLMEDIVHAGFSAFNPIEPLAMDIVALKKRVGGRLALIGNVDLSYTLTLGTPAEVDAEVKQLIRKVAPGGGFGLASANSVPEYVPWENLVAMHTAWLTYGRYPINGGRRWL